MTDYKKIEDYMNTFDNLKLFYRAFLCRKPSKKAVIIFHRGHEHSGRLLELIEKLNLNDINIFAWDARGNGKSEGPRDYAVDFSVYIKDCHTFVKYISEKYNIPVENMIVIANSVGGVIASTWVHDYAPPIKALILSAPAFRIKLYIPFAYPLLRFGLKIGLAKYVNSYVKSLVLTHDKYEQNKFNKDPMITHSIATNILLDVYDTSKRIIKDAGAITIPVLLLMAGSDWVVRKNPQRKFFKGISSPDKELVFYKKFFHSIYHEKQRNLPIEKTRDFILKIFKENKSLPSLINADKEGYTKKEYDSLSKINLNLFFLLNKLLLKTIGRLSKGVRLGWKTGFDSGISLDYVYKNKPKGLLLLGWIIDKVFLNSIGWKGIRQRKINIEKTILNLIENLKQKKKEINILDIAAGPGRYILDIIKNNPDKKINALLCDNTEINIKEGKKIRDQLNLRGVEYKIKDAFKKESYSSLTKKPNIVIASGLYELFPSNEPILTSLKGIHDCLSPDGYFVYTNQPWHPQVEYIAKVLINRDKKPWIMRRRTQAEMDDLVKEAGFKKIDMEIDKWGIFSVSLAVKI